MKIKQGIIFAMVSIFIVTSGRAQNPKSCRDRTGLTKIEGSIGYDKPTREFIFVYLRTKSLKDFGEDFGPSLNFIGTKRDIPIIEHDTLRGSHSIKETDPTRQVTAFVDRDTESVICLDKESLDLSIELEKLSVRDLTERVLKIEN